MMNHTSIIALTLRISSIRLIKCLLPIVAAGLALSMGIAFARAGTVEPDHLSLAESAVADLVRNFWTGDAATGHVKPSWGGQPTKEMRTPIWEMGTFVIAVENLYETNHDPILRQRILAEWRFLKRWHPPKDMTAIGEGSLQNALDDAMSVVLVCLTVYRVTEDTQCLTLAGDVLTHAWDRWHDNKLGGGLWYRDLRDIKSDWCAFFALMSLRLYELNGERIYWDRAKDTYEWEERSLLRPDGLYYRYLGKDGSIQNKIIDTARETHNDASLLGNTLMGILHARMYRDTGSRMYLLRALRTVHAVTTKETDGKSCLLNDDDAWMDGAFVGEWATEVLSLPGVADDDQAVIRRTADGIMARDRTPDGHFGPCWNGPLGAGCPWDTVQPTWRRATPDQTATSSGAVNIVAAAAALDARRPWPAPRRPPG